MEQPQIHLSLSCAHLQPRQWGEYKAVLLLANSPAPSQVISPPRDPRASQKHMHSLKGRYVLYTILGHQLESFSSVGEGLPSQTGIWSTLEVHAVA